MDRMALAEEEGPARQTHRTWQTWSGNNTTQQRVQRSRSPHRELQFSKKVLPHRPADEQASLDFQDDSKPFPPPRNESCATPKSDTVDRSTCQTRTLERMYAAIPRRTIDTPQGRFHVALSDKEKAARKKWLKLFKARQLDEQKKQASENRAQRNKRLQDEENSQRAEEEEPSESESDLGDEAARWFTRQMKLCHPLSAKWENFHEEREEARKKAAAVLGGAGPPVPPKQVPTAPRVAKPAQVAPKGGVAAVPVAVPVKDPEDIDSGEEDDATTDPRDEALLEMGFPTAKIRALLVDLD